MFSVHSHTLYKFYDSRTGIEISAQLKSHCAAVDYRRPPGLRSPTARWVALVVGGLGAPNYIDMSFYNATSSNCRFFADRAWWIIYVSASTIFDGLSDHEQQPAVLCVRLLPRRALDRVD